MSTTETGLDQQVKALEAAKRRRKIKLCQDSLLEFAQFMSPDPTDPDDITRTRYILAPHIQLIAEALEKVERGEILNLAISMPPRHGKSELCTRMFPAWFVGKDPYRQVVLGGYSAEFAESEFGAKVRRVMTSPQYKQVFPLATLQGGSKAVGNLVLREGGNIASVGRGGPITGRGADIAIIDDPIKDDEEAQSAGERQKLFEWFTSTVMSRMMPGGRKVIIQTRWHEDDLIGRICDPTHPEHNPDVAAGWVYLNIPALIEEPALAKAMGLTLRPETDPQIIKQFGTKPIVPLWESRYGSKFFAEIKRTNPRVFTALYQGKPSPDDGDYFKREWLIPYAPEELPKNLVKYCASDHAISEAEGADYSCFGTAGRDENGIVWILPDLYWEKESDTNKIVDEMIDMMLRQNPAVWWAERGHISKAILPILHTEKLRRKCYTLVDDDQIPSKDKRTRARSIQGMFGMKQVRVPTFAPWWEKAQSELLKFPNGTHDDFVDMISWIGIGLLREYNAPQEKEREKTYATGTVGWLLRASRAEKRNRHLKLVVNGR